MKKHKITLFATKLAATSDEKTRIIHVYVANRPEAIANLWDKGSSPENATQIGTLVIDEEKQMMGYYSCFGRNNEEVALPNGVLKRSIVNPILKEMLVPFVAFAEGKGIFYEM